MEFVAKDYKFHVFDVDNKRVMAICDNVMDANHIAHALNFNHRPKDYGYIMEREDDGG
jgi:hypothetical protein